MMDYKEFRLLYKQFRNAYTYLKGHWINY